MSTFSHEVVGDTVGEIDGEAVGSAVVGEADGETVGSEVVGEIVGNPVGASVTHCDGAQEEPQVDLPGGMMQVGRETVRADPQLRPKKAISLRV